MKLLKSLFLITCAVSLFVYNCGFLRASNILVRVDDRLITEVDVDKRIYVLNKLALPGQDIGNQLRRDKVLRSLIREEVKRSAISKVRGDLDTSTINLEAVEQNWAMMLGISIEHLYEVKAEDPVVREELEQILDTEAKWQVILGHHIQSRQKEPVSQTELILEIEHLRRFSGQPEFLLQEIFLASDPQQSEQRQAELAELASKIAADGASAKVDFASLAERYTQNITNLNGGFVGWLSASQLPKEALTILEEMGQNEISPAIKGEKGWYIYKVLNRRLINISDRLVNLYYIAMSLDPQNPDQRENVLAKLESLRQIINSCANAEAIANDNATQDLRNDYIRNIPITQLDSRTLDIIKKLRPDETSSPEIFANTAQIFTLCSFRDGGERKQAKEILRRQIVMQGYQSLERELFNQMQRRAVILFGDEE